jgi:hypothetical protein
VTKETTADRPSSIGTVLAERSGNTLCTPQQVAHGTILCTGGCLSF